MSENVVAFVFARGGSKGIPRKNLALLGEKPLLVHSIDVGKKVRGVTKVVVSTDDAEIADVARKAGAEVPFLRPPELAGDTVPEWLAWQHAVRALREAGEKVDVFLSLPATAPLRTAADVECCLEALSQSANDIVITVREAARNPHFNVVKKQGDGTFCLALAGQAVVHRRQDAPPLYDVTTVAYAARGDFVLRASSIFEGKVGAVEIPKERALDIDDMYDLRLAEVLLNAATSGRPARTL